MSGNNFQKYNSQGILKNFFKDRDTYNFKYGLEYGLESSSYLSALKGTENSKFNLDEDPTMLGFDLFILDNSPLFNDMDNYLNTFGRNNNITDITNRIELYDDFINQFSKFFNVDDSVNTRFKSDGRFQSFKTHYINSVNGLNNLIYKTPVGGEGVKSEGNQFTKFGSDKITISLSEDVGLNAGYLSSVYRNLIFSKKNGREIIPENLQRFDMAIVISEIRNFNRIATELNSETPIFSVFNDNIDRYIFTLYECQLDFKELSFGENITQGGLDAQKPSFSKGINFDIFYKYVGYEMEKFEFDPNALGGINDTSKYINDQRNKPTSFQVNTSSDSQLNSQSIAPTDDKLPDRVIDRKFQQNTPKNTEELKRYEFDFPMLNPNYQINKQDKREENQEIQQNQGSFRGGLNNIIDLNNQRLQQFVSSQRAQLVSDLAENLREVTGLRNIQSPTNVYQGSNVGQFLLGKIKDFANLGVSEALSEGSSYLNKQAKGVEDSIFDKANNGVEKLKGFSSPTGNESPLSQRGNSTIPNVYKR